jgi:hypothetical protein
MEQRNAGLLYGIEGYVATINPLAHPLRIRDFKYPAECPHVRDFETAAIGRVLSQKG